MQFEIITRHPFHPLQKPSASHEGKAGNYDISAQQLEVRAGRPYLEQSPFGSCSGLQKPQGESREPFSTKRFAASKPDGRNKNVLSKTDDHIG